MKRYKVWITVEEYDTVRLDDGTECQSNWQDIHQEYSDEYISLAKAKRIFNSLVNKINEMDGKI